MAELKVEGPSSQSVAIGEKAKFEITISGGTAPYKIEWLNTEGNKIPGSPDGLTFEIDKVAPSHAGIYRAAVTDKEGKTASSKSVTLTVATNDRPLLWDATFAFRAAALTAGVFVLVMLPVWISMQRVFPAKGEESHFAGVIAAQSVVVGTLILLCGIYLALLDLRGRSRTKQELAELSGGQFGAFGLGDALKEAPAIIKAFGELKAPAAAMAAGIALFICAAAIAWKAVPDSTPTPGGASGATGVSGPSGSTGPAGSTG